MVICSRWANAPAGETILKEVGGGPPTNIQVGKLMLSYPWGGGQGPAVTIVPS